MRVIKTIKRGKYELKHGWYLDPFGIPTECVELTVTNNGSGRVHIGFMPPFRVKDYNPNTNVLSKPEAYSKKEYDEMFSKFIKQVQEMKYA
jgi:hypothetical protein